MDLHVPAAYATIQLAVNAAAPGDVVVIAPGIYNERVDCWGKNNLTLRSSTGDWSSVEISWALPDSTVYMTHNVTIKDMTVVYSGADETKGCLEWAGAPPGTLRVENCYLHSRGCGVVGGNGTIDMQRTRMRYSGTGVYGMGVQALDGTVRSSLIQSFPKGGVYYDQAGLGLHTTVISTTVVHTSGFFGIRADHVHNCLVYDSQLWGILAAVGSSYCVCWDSGTTDFVWGKGGDDYDTTDVVADGRPIFTNPAADYHLIGPGSLAIHNGTPVAFLDLDGLPYSTPPSRGAFEYVAPAPSGQPVSVRPSIACLGRKFTKV